MMTSSNDENATLVSKSALKAKMFEYLRNVEASGIPLVVTDYGKPVLKILPFQEKKNMVDLFADQRGKVVYHEDINAPTQDEWNID